MNLRWEKDDRPHAWGSVLMLGRWRVGSTNGGSGSKGDPKSWAAYCSLPGIKDFLDRHETEELAKARIERAVNLWIKGCEMEKQP